jgi:hypothetical protein
MSDATDDTDERLRLVKPDDQAALKPSPYARMAGKARQAADGAGEPAPAGDGDGNEPALWPSFTDPYQAAGNPAKNEMTRLVVVLGREGMKPDATARMIFQYPLLDIGAGGVTASGDQWFSFLWSGLEPMQVKVYGRNLERICDYISLRRMPWIRVADRDFRPAELAPADAGGGADDTPVITHIEITRLKD